MPTDAAGSDDSAGWNRRLALKVKWLICILFVLLLAVSCGGEEPDPTPGEEGVTPSPSEPAPEDTPEPAAPTRPPLSLDTPFSLRPGQSERVDDLEITLTGITEDSRCPPDVQCFWQGQVGVQLEVVVAGIETQAITLTSVMSPIMALLAHQITLVAVEPGPATAGSTIPLSEYVVTLQVAARSEPGALDR
jgi:hypothetical protein